MRPLCHPVLVLVGAALLLGGCLTPSVAEVPPGIPTAQPTARATAKPTPTFKPTPTPVAALITGDVGCDAIPKRDPLPPPEARVFSMPHPTIAGPSASSAAAITVAMAALRGLRSYQFSVLFYARDLVELKPSTVDFGLDGTAVHRDGFAIDARFGFQMREFDNSAAVSSSSRLVVGAGNVWTTDNVSGVLEPAPSGFDQLQLVPGLTPEGVADRLLRPFASGYRRLADTKHDGVMTRHYRAVAGGLRAYSSALHFDGELSADIWIASKGGYLAAATIRGTKGRIPGSKERRDEFVILLQVTHPNHPANVVELPVPPVPDPPRATRQPIDLQLQYVVQTPDGRFPTEEELNAIAVTLRRRLDVASRRLTVDVVVPETLIVTICQTTRPEDDRRAVESTGQLTVVGLPVGDYGSTTVRPLKSLPVAGETIDPTLRAIAPPGPLGSAAVHVDPETGQRGVAFTLRNDAANAFRDYAAVHPGEYVAIVLDGTVLATQPIDGQVANGKFAFTGDYTAAEARWLRDRLHTDPLPYALLLTRHLEVPGSGP